LTVYIVYLEVITRQRCAGRSYGLTQSDIGPMAPASISLWWADM